MKSFYYFVLTALCGALVVTSFYLGFFSGLENFFEDLLFSPRAVSSDIIIVAIDDESILRLGQWPWPREYLARAIVNMSNYAPRVLGVDVVYSEKSRLGADDDAVLTGALSGAKFSIIFPVESKGGDNFLKPLPAFTAAPNVSLGHVNLILDRDGKVRRFPLKIFDFEAWALAVVEKSGAIIPDKELPSDVSRIVYAAEPGSIRRIPFWQVVEGVGLERLRDKIVLAGVTAPDLHDSQRVPMGRGSEMAGIEIQASIVNMLLLGYRLVPLDRWAMSWWILLAALMPAIIFVAVRRLLWAIGLSFSFGAVYLVAAILFFELGYTVNMLHVQMAWIISAGVLFGYRYFTGERERRELRETFSKYVSPEVLEHILENPARVKLGGEEKELTVLFSDIRGFTTLSEKTSPQELVGILNRYFTLMTDEVLKYGGVLDKYIGDAVMAFWGAPVEDGEQADNAVKAALGMVAALQKFNKELEREGKSAINIGIGIYTGRAVVGNIGSAKRLSYTVMGDTVNTASRLEGLNKEYKTNIIIGESTKLKLRDNYNFKLLGGALVKGKTVPVEIYAVEPE